MNPVTNLVGVIFDHWSWDNPIAHFDHKGYHVTARWVDGTDEDPPELTIIVPEGAYQADLSNVRNLAHDAVVSWFSEATNDDACDVDVREISAHLDANRDVPIGVEEDSVVIIARVLDSLT